MDFLEHFIAVDLTHPLNSSVPTWSGGCGFTSEIKMDYSEGLRVQSYKMHAGIGTHMDAPSHFFREGLSMADLSLDTFIASLHVIDVRAKRHPTLFISPEDIEAYETKYGRISKKSFVIGFTGWQEFWNDPDLYRHEKEGKKQFPGFSKEAAALLIEREVVGLGIDTLSPDGSDTMHFPVHHLFLGSGRYLVENLCHLQQLPARGAIGFFLPLNVQEGSEAPLRAIALIPRNKNAISSI